jgi:RNA polymerase sigma-70 factor (ECF subfamily)
MPACSTARAIRLCREPIPDLESACPDASFVEEPVTNGRDMSPAPVTRLLQESRNGSKEAFDQLVPHVYDKLRQLAAGSLRGEGASHTARATSLVHEAYLRLAGADVDWQNRMHFYAVAAQVMRRILVDHAKAKNRDKRGGGAQRVTLDEAVLVQPDIPNTVLDLDDALKRLAARDPRKSQIVEMLFFGGMTYDETAGALQISPATVHRELKLAKAWLYRELNGPAA